LCVENDRIACTRLGTLILIFLPNRQENLNNRECDLSTLVGLADIARVRAQAAIKGNENGPYSLALAFLYDWQRQAIGKQFWMMFYLSDERAHFHTRG
jgi:hypothetical protein